MQIAEGDVSFSYSKQAASLRPRHGQDAFSTWCIFNIEICFVKVNVYNTLQKKQKHQKVIWLVATQGLSIKTMKKKTF